MAVQPSLAVLLILYLLPCSASQRDAQIANFSFNLITSSSEDPVYEVGMENTVTVVDMALVYINSNPELLPAINLTYGTTVNSLECALSQGALQQEAFGILGYGCDRHNASKQQLLAAAPKISFSPSSPDQFGQRSIYTLHPTPATYAESVVTLLRQFNWQRITVLTSGGSFYVDVKDQLMEENITVESMDLFPKNVRIFFLNTHRLNATEILCKAYHEGHFFPRYVWITYQADFIMNFNPDGEHTCTRQQLAKILDGIFLLKATDDAPKNSSLSTIQEHLQSLQCSPLDYFAFDAVWVVAHILNNTVLPNQTNSSGANITEATTSNSSQGRSYGDLDSALQEIIFEGVTGIISFDVFGNRIHNTLSLYQVRSGESILIARIFTESGKESTFIYHGEENSSTIFRGPIPSDGSPLKMIHITPLPLIIIYWGFAGLGIIFVFICLLFTIIFRKRIMVKSTSPNLNYFILLGAFFLYSLTIVRLYPTTLQLFAEVLCHLQAFVVCLGYVLCFAPILMKMWRVFYVFRNPFRKKPKMVKDRHLVLGVVTAATIIVIMEILGSAIPALRPQAKLVPDKERPTGITDDGIEIIFCSYECYKDSFLPLMWVGVQLLYMLLIQMVALILAIVNRNVSLKILNDFRSTTIIIYTTTVILVCLGVITLTVTSYIIVTDVLYFGGIMLATTILLSFTFIPKMIALFRDPNGKDFFRIIDTEIGKI